ELDMEGAQMQAFNKWATDHQLNQEGYQTLLGLYAENLYALEPNMADIKASLGDKADERIAAAASWAKANLEPALYEQFRAATAGQNAAAVFDVVEAVISKTRQVAPPKPGASDPSSTPLTGTAAIKAAREQKTADGRLLYFDQGIEGQRH